MIIPWRQLFWVYLAIFLLVSCTHDVTPNVRLTPPTDQNPVIVGSEVPHWREICVEREFSDTSDLGRYDCVTVGELRAMVKHRVRADN